MLVDESDDLCLPCSHLDGNGQCGDVLSQLDVSVSKQKYNDALDQRLFHFLQLEPGSVVSLGSFLVIVQGHFDELVPLCLHPLEDFNQRRDGLRKGLVILKSISYQ